MNLIGETLTVLDSTDPSKKGKTGVVVLETAKTLLLDSGTRTLMIEKAGSVFQVGSSKKVFAGEDFSGRLEDRWGARTK